MLFTLLEVFCFYLIVNYNDNQQQIWLNSSSIWIGTANQRLDDMLDYLSLKSQNKKLLEENEKLLAQRIDAFYDNHTGSDSVHIDSLKQQFIFRGAKIINKNFNGTHNTITINRGKKAGIQSNMGVISGNGVVGVVTKVSDHFATVMTIFHRDARISASIKSSGEFGSLVWNGPDLRHINLEAIPNYVEIKLNDTIQTSGYSNIFPQGINIGTIIKSDEKPEGYREIKVKLMENLRTLQHVYVVENLMKDDLETLEPKEK